MTTSPVGDPSAEPVERFKPTTGLLPGYVGLGLVAFGIGYVLLQVHTMTGLRVGLGLVSFGVVIWVTQLRSRAAAYPSYLLLKNALVDVAIPLRLVDEVSVGRTLNVYVGDKRHVCIGIGKSARASLGRKSATGQSLGLGRLHEYAETAKRPSREESAMSYETFVVTRIRELVEEAQKKEAASPPEPVRRLHAWPEIVALAFTATAFLITLSL